MLCLALCSDTQIAKFEFEQLSNKTMSHSLTVVQEIHSVLRSDQPAIRSLTPCAGLTAMAMALATAMSLETPAAPGQWVPHQAELQAFLIRDLAALQRPIPSVSVSNGDWNMKWHLIGDVYCRSFSHVDLLTTVPRF